MLYQLLMTAYITICFLLGLIVLVQQSKSSAGIGAFSGDTQMLLGGSGGQDFLQKATWVLGTLLMLGSLTLSLWKYRQVKGTTTSAPVTQQQGQQ